VQIDNKERLVLGGMPHRSEQRRSYAQTNSSSAPAAQELYLGLEN